MSIICTNRLVENCRSLGMLCGFDTVTVGSVAESDYEFEIEFPITAQTAPSTRPLQC